MRRFGELYALSCLIFFLNAGGTNCVFLNSITDGIDVQIRKNCLDDCPPSDTTKCTTNCYENCIRERSIEMESGCFFKCGVPTSKNPMCFATCVLNVDRSGAIQSCKNDCDAPPLNTQCDRCARICRRRTQSELQLGRSDFAPVVHCNPMCDIPQLDCNTCEDFFLQQGTRCTANCKQGTRDCSMKCMTACTSNLVRIRQGECFNECFRKIDSLPCLASCFDKFKNDPPNKVCETECTNSPKIGDCTSCENNCKTSMEKLLKSFCSPAQKVCRTISKCETCTVEVGNKCKGKCRPSGASETPERCRNQCLDVCEPIRDYLVANNASGGTYIPSCEIFCAQSALTKCLARCENFCEKTAALICNCSKDGENYSDKDVNEISVLVPDGCRNCRRGLRRGEHLRCQRDCVPTATSDPNGVKCFSQCLDFCEKAEWFRHQVSCAQSCTENKIGCGGSEQLCLDKAIDHHQIRSRCFERCYNTKYDPMHFVCFPQRCQDQCAEEGAIAAPFRCLRATPTAICTDKGFEIVAMGSTPKISECSACTRKIRIYHLDVCRRTCEIKNTDGQLDVNKFCTESCQMTCMTRLYWNQYMICQQSSPKDVTKCVKDAVPDLKQMCATTECPTTNFPTGLSVGQCPNCIDHCYKNAFFEAAARIMCNPCNPTSQPQPQQTALACDICKSARVESTCENAPPGCTAERTCIDKHCTDTCNGEKTHLEPTCAEECNNGPTTKTMASCLLNCTVLRQREIANCVSTCQGSPKPNECQNKCTKEECQKDLTERFCQLDCSGTIPELGVGTPLRRRRQVRPPPRPTRTPRPTGVDFTEQHWCCSDNGAGRCNSSNPGKLRITVKPEPNGCKKHADATAGPKWCTFQEKLREGSEERCKSPSMQFDKKNLKYFLSIFLMIGWGAFVRSILKATGINIPETVVLMISGLLIGILSSYFCDELHEYTAFTRTPPSVLRFLFLPVLIFESAYSIQAQTFTRRFLQIFLISLPGVILSTILTACICHLMLDKYPLGFRDWLLFATIVTPVDPGAIVDQLRQAGRTEILSVFVEGEGLLADGEIVLFFFDLLEMLYEGSSGFGEVTSLVVQKFLVVAIGGPLFGWMMAKIAIFCLSRIFNDATVEITITLVAAYLTYFIGDHMLHVSGVMAVVVLGLTMSSEKTSISHEVESRVQQFWELLGYLANTVLFVLVGTVITESAINNLQWYDLYYLMFMYFTVNIVRFAVLFAFSPVLLGTGYQLKWTQLVVMMWCGLRGAVGLCLAIEVYNGENCGVKQTIGSPILIQTAGVVFLTLIVNGTTTEILLKELRLTEISARRLQDMTNATKQLTASQIRTLNMLKHDRFLADANWTIVEKFTGISDPYKAEAPKPKIQYASSLISIRLDQIDHMTECPTCLTLVVNEPTESEFVEMTEEARFRILKALEDSVWKQFEEGNLTELTTQHLVGLILKTFDKGLPMIRTSDVQKYVKPSIFINWLYVTFFKRANLTVGETVPNRPSFKLRIPFWYLATRDWFDGAILFLIVLNLIPILWELVLMTKGTHEGNDAFFYVNVAFTMLYTLELVIKLIGRGPMGYIKNRWNYMDAIVLFLSYVEIGLYFTENQSISQIFGIFRVARLPPIVINYNFKVIDTIYLAKINEELFLGYELGKGFVEAVDEVIKVVPQMVHHPRIQGQLIRSLESVRLDTVREMGLVQEKYSGHVVAVKTRLAIIAVMNTMSDTLLELEKDRLVDDKENDALTGIIKENMKKLWYSPSSISPSPPEVLLANVSWVIGHDELLTYVHNHATIINFNSGDTICSAGDEPDGIWLIVSGMIKIHYQPNLNLITAQEDFGKIPNMELFLDLTLRRNHDDFFSTGTVLGEQSVLTGEKRAASVTSETSVLAYHIPQEVMKKALDIFKSQRDSLESRLWRAVGIRLAAALLPSQPFYQKWTVDKIRLHLERSAVPLGPHLDELKFQELVSDVVVIQGQLRNYHKVEEVYTAPCLLPHTCIQVTSHPNNEVVPPRILVIAHEDIDNEESTPSEESLLDNIVKASSKRKSVPTELTTARDRRLSVSLNFGARRASASLQTARKASKRSGSLAKVAPAPTSMIQVPKITLTPPSPVDEL